MKCTFSALILGAAAVFGAAAEEQTGFLQGEGSQVMLSEHAPTGAADLENGGAPGGVIGVVVIAAMLILAMVFRSCGSFGSDGDYQALGSGSGEVPTGPVHIRGAEGESLDLFTGDIEDGTANHFVVAAGEGSTVSLDRQVVEIAVNADETFSLKGAQHGYWFAGRPTDNNNNHFVLAKGPSSVDIDESRMKFKISSAGKGRFYMRPCDSSMGRLFVDNTKNRNGNFFLLAKGAESQEIDASRCLFTITPAGSQ